jgi:anti-sigma-K factor RskA
VNPVDPAVNDRDDHYYEELLGAAAFGTLTAEEEIELQAHLASSESARAELAELRIIAGDLSLLADEMEPPVELRDRLERAIQTDLAWANPTPLRPVTTEQGPGEVQPLNLSSVPEGSSRRPISIWRNSMLAAAAVLLVAVLAGVVLDRVFFDDDSDPDGRETIAFELSSPIPNLSAELTYESDDQVFLLKTGNMPAAPEGQVYQVWLIDREGVPVPNGVMVGSSHAVSANRDDYAAFAITVEPGPLGSTAPTTEPFFVAPLTPEASE